MENSKVLTGFWVNEAKGPVLGLTLTVTPANGLLLVAVLALFVTLAGSQSWFIICFALHQFRSKIGPKHGMHFQQQVVLRNTGMEFRTAWQFWRIAWAWRRQRVNSFRNSTGIIVLGLAHLALFGVAGVFVPKLARVSNEVLVRSPYCGYWRLNSTTASYTELADQDVQERSRADSSKEYVRQCLNGYQSSPECNIFKRPSLPITAITNASCPFAPTICAGPANTSVQGTTGFLDSVNDFGFNTKQEDKVLYRKLLACSPLVTDGFITHGTSSLHGRAYNYTAAFYGPNVPMPSVNDIYGNVPNATYVRSDYKSMELYYDRTLSDPPYTVIPISGYQSEPTAGFVPIPELFSENGNTVVIFAAFDGMYISPSDDLWLSAHQPVVLSVGPSGGPYKNITFYQPDNPVSPLGCLEQHQICNPNRPANSTNRCTPLGGIDILGLHDAFTSPLDTDHQIEVARIILKAATMADLRVMIPDLPSPLLASSYIAGAGISTSLPDNQWVSEVSSLFSTAVTLIQRGVAEIATGPGGSFDKYTANSTAADPELAWFCYNFVLQNSSFTSFSVLALSLVLGLGAIVILTSCCIDVTVAWLQQRYKRGLYRQLHWKIDSALQLQRMAFEEAGLGTWEKCQCDIPVVKIGEKIEVATEWDECHPSIKGKRVSVEDFDSESVKETREVVRDVDDELSPTVTAVNVGMGDSMVLDSAPVSPVSPISRISMEQIQPGEVYGELGRLERYDDQRGNESDTMARP